ncbi:MAG: MarR family transcriptional regulator [Pseudomonadota bacterium]
MTDPTDQLANSVFAEILAVDQLARAHVSKALPQGMELSHFSVLNHLVHINQERSPAQLASVFHVTKGAMTNTLSKLEWMGYVHIRPDWDDARRKMVAISPAGRDARDAAFRALSPVIRRVVNEIGEDKARSVLPILRAMRISLNGPR